MDDFILTTPVALLVFNRPELTTLVFAAIREARPPKLLVVADGPRQSHSKDEQKCAEVRHIVEQVDWSCEVMYNFSEKNLGCKMRVSSGLDWVFGQVEEAIILEDDCLPDRSFFRFCQELLQYYRNDERVMTICGANLLGRWQDDRQSYHFAQYDFVWGWASWRRAWRYYDIEMRLWNDLGCRQKIRAYLQDDRLWHLREKTFQQAFDNRIDTWDYQWAFARSAQEGLAIVPSVNLVTNLGYGTDATHTVVMDEELAAIPTGVMAFPLVHNDSLVSDRQYDETFVAILLRKNSLMARIISFFRLVMVRIGCL